jgi:hypothetical protein
MLNKRKETQKEISRQGYTGASEASALDGPPIPSMILALISFWVRGFLPSKIFF